MRDVLAIATGGALGAVARHALSSWVQWRVGNGFPWGTLAVNVLGCALLGFLVAWVDAGSGWSPRLRAALTTGALGAFTTFSTFGLETVSLWRDGQPVSAGLNVALQLLCGLGAVVLGAEVARRALGSA